MLFQIIKLLILMSLFCNPFTGQAKSLSQQFLRPHVANQLLVKYKNSAAKRALFRESNITIKYEFKFNGAVLLELPPSVREQNSEALQAFAQQLQNNPDVEYVEPNFFVHALKTPNDPQLDELYAINNSNPNASGNINALKAWDITTGSRSIIVGVIDTGIDYNHADLAGNYWNNPGETGQDAYGNDKKNNGIDDDKNGFIDDWRGWDFVNNDNDPMDDEGHGTHCAGTIGAVGNNGVGISGINWNISMVGIKFLDDAGNGTVADSAKAIEYATTLGVHITSNSWGGDDYTQTVADALANANKAGILFVVAAGNESNDNDTSSTYPASYNIPNVLSVAATDSDDQLAGFSNYGANSVHIAAPGVGILSTYPNNSYKSLDGTSMAAPYVSGAAALVKSLFPKLSAVAIKARLLGSADTVSSLKGQVQTGRLNIFNALDSNVTPPSAPNNITVFNYSATTADLQWGVIANNGKTYSYEARISSNPITSETDWERATTQPIVVLKSTTAAIIKTQIQKLSVNSSGFLSIKTIDNMGNKSSLSDSVSYALPKVQPAYHNSGDSLHNIIFAGTWGIEDLPNYGKVISDSPNGNYGFGQNMTLMLPVIDKTNALTTLSFNMKYDFEAGYDYGFVELSTNNGRKWKELMKFSGTLSWTNIVIPLKEFIDEPNTAIVIRFRSQSDATSSNDGLYLSNIDVYM